MMPGEGESVARDSAFAVVLYAGMVALTAHLSDPWTIEGHDVISEAYGPVCFSFASLRNLCRRTKGNLSPRMLKVKLPDRASEQNAEYARLAAAHVVPGSGGRWSLVGAQQILRAWWRDDQAKAAAAGAVKAKSVYKIGT